MPLKLPAVVQHVQVLEASGLIRSERSDAYGRAESIRGGSLAWRIGSQRAARTGNVVWTGWTSCSPTRKNDPVSIEHATFVVERSYALSSARVFAAWADPELKARWFCEPGGHYELDFRVGGRKINRDGTPGGPGYTYAAEYRDIVPNERIVYTYELHAAEALAPVSSPAWPLGATEGHGTEMTLTEQIAALDGLDTAAARERDMRSLLGRLGDPAPCDRERLNRDD